jgi:predicted RNA binding protein YcfA (HicA-like mRNA interferase family)
MPRTTAALQPPAACAPRLLACPVRKVTRALESVGFSWVPARGSHAVYRNREGRVAVIRSTASCSAAQ